MTTGTAPAKRLLAEQIAGHPARQASVTTLVATNDARQWYSTSPSIEMTLVPAISPAAATTPSLMQQMCGSFRTQQFFPWWPRPLDELSITYHTRTKLHGEREGLLPDPGAHGNLFGNKFVKRLTDLALAAGYKESDVKWEDLPAPIPVGGVGAGAQHARRQVTIPIEMEDHVLNETYTGIVVGDDDNPSDVPAL